MNNHLSSNQLAVINKEFSDNNETLSAGLLARLLGKQKGHVIRKIESLFPKQLLSKMETNSYQIVGLGGMRENRDYRLNRKQAIALAMTYDVMLGMALVDALDNAIAGLNAVTEANTLEDAQSTAALALGAVKTSLSYDNCDHLSSNERHTALKRLR
ncbi:hypothetical protein FND52_08905 [Atlantibacter subterranea]|uniref:hypothetical protein n=1 Tax=Atlantibacter subterraneus TaxID=255519 RepID=UPI0011824E3F|nr:hypothetical protein [Atlantibacter subterranea]TSJ58136.1 hypothetical protein FND52_08905 [Atlantibacter subterranea]